MKTCQKCGAEMADAMNFCPKCHAKYDGGKSAPAAETPEPQSGKKKKHKLAAGIGGAVLCILAVLVPVWQQYFMPKMLDKARAENLQKALVNYGFKKNKIEVRHLDGKRFGVWVISLQIGDDKQYYHNESEPAFCMILNEDTNKFEFSSARDRKRAGAFLRLTDDDDENDGDALSDLD